MKATLRLDRNMRFIGTNELGLETIFDTHPEVGGEDTAPAPMEIMLQSLAACSSMDVIPILKKKRKTVTKYWVDITAERAEQHPKVITKVHMIYNFESPDAEQADIERAIELSQQKYCGISTMFRASGCEVTFETKLNG